jgi:hypothetical protein
VVLSLNKPVAVKDNFVPVAMVRPEGVTEIDTITAFVTLSVVEALMEPSFAVIVVLPGLRAFARPLLPIVATVVSDEVQATFPVTLCVLPSE